MSFKEVTNHATDIKKFKDKPFIGTYNGSQTITTKIGEQTIWKFTDDDGNYLGIYGFTNLNRIMENVQEGKLCRVTYLGTKNIPTKFGNKDVHQVRVEVDDEEKLPSEKDKKDLPF